MNKNNKVKNAVLAVLLSIIAVTVVFYVSIYGYNNRIAKSLEYKLRSCQLPEKTELIDSESVAEKVFGNGNGMQWFGMILVKSDLDEKELLDWYSERLEPDESCELEVLEQKSPLVFKDVQTDMLYIFDDCGDSEENCFQVRIFKSSVSGLEESFSEKLLNLDFRAH